jgi:integrase
VVKKKGWIKRESRKLSGDVWVYRHYVTRPADGKRVEHTSVIGSLVAYPKIADAWAEVTRRKLDRTPLLVAISAVTFEQLVDQYRQTSLKKLAYSTQLVYEHIIDNYLTPRWGQDSALEIQPVEIEQWLGTFTLANASKSKLLKTMSTIYKRAQKYGLIPRTQEANPCIWVDQTAQSDYEAITLTPKQSTDIIAVLPLDVQTLTILIAGTGLRISEALALKWSDIDYTAQRIYIRRAWVKQRIGETKTKASRSHVPCSPLLVGFLQAWREATTYPKPGDWVFASRRKLGKEPRRADALTQLYLRPAAIAAGVPLATGQRFGFHTFRHSLSSALVNSGTDIKTVQALLRHADASTTLGIYTHASEANKLVAQAEMMERLFVGTVQ